MGVIDRHSGRGSAAPASTRAKSLPSTPSSPTTPTRCAKKAAASQRHVSPAHRQPSGPGHNLTGRGRYTTHCLATTDRRSPRKLWAPWPDREAAAPCEHDVGGYQRPHSLGRHRRERFRWRTCRNHRRVAAPLTFPESRASGVWRSDPAPLQEQPRRPGPQRSSGVAQALGSGVAAR